MRSSLFFSFALVSSFSAAQTTSEPGHPISPRILQEMVGTIASSDGATSKLPLKERTIPFPAAIAYDKNGCFAGYFPNSALQNIRFACIEGQDRLSLQAVHPKAAKLTQGAPVVLELIPSFANNKCTACGTMGTDLRNQLKTMSIKAHIVRVDIGYR
jgi:hypothetical protein